MKPFHSIVDSLGTEVSGCFRNKYRHTHTNWLVHMQLKFGTLNIFTYKTLINLLIDNKMSASGKNRISHDNCGDGGFGNSKHVSNVFANMSSTSIAQTAIVLV
jgi:hypothetical protein